MSSHSNLHDVYFDALKLKEELDNIPPACDCSEETRRAGRCCCHMANPVFHAELARKNCHGCVARLERLRSEVEWLWEDLAAGGQSLSNDDLTSDEQKRVFRFIYTVHRLAAAVGRIEGRLDEYQTSCAYEDLARLKECGAELLERAAEFNQAIP